MDHQHGPPARDRRFPASVYRHGTEPDPRFSLANERTFLAWIRTSLALLAAGVALEGLALPLQPDLRLAASIVLVVLGVLAPVQAWRGWARDERAMRLGAPLAAPALASPLTVGTVVAGVLVLLGLLLR
ncbi:YidH family protein [Kineococcus sp. SYSU DK002]|uniref:YidH family protein n=1 Tax=Kineococcus sp. SYSU DK002 TaxID=3383123 RepID=UPI003D7EAD33